MTWNAVGGASKYAVYVTTSTCGNGDNPASDVCNFGAGTAEAPVIVSTAAPLRYDVTPIFGGQASAPFLSSMRAVPHAPHLSISARWQEGFFHIATYDSTDTIGEYSPAFRLAMPTNVPRQIVDHAISADTGHGATLSWSAPYNRRATQPCAKS